MNLYSNDAETFADWVFSIFATLEKTEAGKVAMILWNIWRQRNEKLWYNSCQNEAETVHSALEFFVCLVGSQTARPEFGLLHRCIYHQAVVE